jgi:hypothetical protein
LHFARANEILLPNLRKQRSRAHTRLFDDGPLCAPDYSSWAPPSAHLILWEEVFMFDRYDPRPSDSRDREGSWECSLGSRGGASDRDRTEERDPRDLCPALSIQDKRLERARRY